MHVEKKELPKSQIELTIKLSVDEFKPYVEQGAAKVSREVKINGFRPGKVPYETLKQKIGEMTILEEAGRIAINKTIERAIKDNIKGEPVGQPRVDITKIAPNNPFEYKIILAIVPEIKFGNYKGLKIKERKAEIKEEEIIKMLADIREMKVSEAVVNRELKEGDKAIVDILMFLDKVPVESGQGKDTAIILGKSYIVPGFDKKILGAKKGDTREFSLPYPKDYHMKNLAGKMVEFKVTVKEVYERKLPAFDDKLAENFGVKNIEELKLNVRKSLESQKKQETSQAAEKEMLEKVVDKSRFGDIPEILIENETKTMLAELEQSVIRQGAKFEDYLTSMNKTRDQLTLDLLPDAVKRVKTSLLIRRIGEIEKIKIKEEEIEKNIFEMKKHYKDNKDMAGRFDAPEYRNYAANVLSSRKVIDKLREWNII